MTKSHPATPVATKGTSASHPKGHRTQHNAEKGWIIDVCKTCHRVAKWPFCEHFTNDAPWCIAIPVIPTKTALTMLRKEKSS